jgi:hypothetical protein
VPQRIDAGEVVRPQERAEGLREGQIFH